MSVQAVCGSWQISGLGNSIYDLGNGNYLSYNQAPMIGYEGEETALVVKQNGEKKFLILLGDWREEMEKAAIKDGLGGCLRVYEEHKSKCEGSWSTGV